MARPIWLALELLDHQIVDRSEVRAGNVDDLELEVDEAGDGLRVVALLSGPGLLAQRLGRRSIGRWLQRMADVAGASPSHEGWRIPIERVLKIGAAVQVDAHAADLSSYATERWVQDHVISHVPGSGHAPE